MRPRLLGNDIQVIVLHPDCIELVGGAQHDFRIALFNTLQRIKPHFVEICGKETFQP